jgi:Domain of unknown function (DUF4326)
MAGRLYRKHYREPMPPGTRGVARPSRWQNRHDWRTLGRAEAVRRFEAEHAQDVAYRAAVIRELRGKDLWCYCPLFDEQGQRVPCHAYVLLGWANE